MGRLVDLTGKRFGRLTVVSLDIDDKRKDTRWTCKCDCGNTCSVLSGNLRQGKTRSCGCLRRETAHNIATHRMSRTRLYRIWCDMKNRCHNQKVLNYRNYGGRGIRVCDEWRNSFETFRDWADGSGYSDNLTLERVDLDGDYEPSNCKWITLKQQQRNKTTSRFVEIDGKSKCLSEWCDEFGVNYKTVHHRIEYLGWEPRRALTTPIRKHKEYERKRK